jgi:hypothetical protein
MNQSSGESRVSGSALLFANGSRKPNTHFANLWTVSFWCFLLVGFAFSLPARAGVTITIPGPNVQVVNPAPLFATITSTGAPITNVTVSVGGTQLGSYAGNGSATINIHGVYPLATGSHTVTVTGTDSNNVQYTGTQTFTVASNGSVTQSPVADDEGPSPTSWQATCTANSGQVITAMKVYLDFNSTPVASFTGSTSSLTESQSFSVSNGSHSLTTNCWDGTGQVYQSSRDFAAGAAFPAAPGNATTLNLDNPSNAWTACAGCSGTPGGDAPHTMTYPAEPPNFETLDNDSRDFAITSNLGSTFQGFLWFTSFSNTTGFGPNGPIAWIFDYYVNVTNPLNPDFALEVDGNQTPGAPSGEGYVLGTECNYGANPLTGHPVIWRFDDGNLNGGAGTWNDTYDGGGALSCPLTSQGHWYHVQMYFTVDASTFTYTLHNLRVKDTTLNSVVEDSGTAFTFKGVNSSHGNSLDIQLDGNQNHTYHSDFDKLTIIRW